MNTLIQGRKVLAKSQILYWWIHSHTHYISSISATTTNCTLNNIHCQLIIVYILLVSLFTHLTTTTVTTQQETDSQVCQPWEVVQSPLSYYWQWIPSNRAGKVSQTKKYIKHGIFKGSQAVAITYSLVKKGKSWNVPSLSSASLFSSRLLQTLN
jgi:uncharacterized membrane protein YhaH (DUF805 family)